MHPKCRKGCGLAFALLVTLSAAAANAQTAPYSNLTSLPWSAAVDPPVTRELTFTNRGAQLSGTLSLPLNGGRSPVVVVYHGAGDALRDAPLYRHLIAMLPPLGIGVFVYDRRGSGKSNGPTANGDYELLADDGIAARRMLEQLPGVDGNRIGYWGLSQGGWLAALAAQRDPKCAFAISVSAPMVTADAQMRFAIANILRIRGYDQSAIDQAVGVRHAVDEFMRGRMSREEAQRQLDAASSQPWFDLIYMDRTFRDPKESGWAREMRNDPMAVMRTVSSPMLLIYGAADPWVPVQTSLQSLTQLSDSRRNLQVRVIAGADHAMMTSVTPLAQVDPNSMARQSPEAPEYFAVMADWLARMGFTARP